MYYNERKGYKYKHSYSTMSIKLSYFDLRGRAETSRLVLHAAKKSFVDNRIPFSEWSKVKPTTPFGSVPVLEVNGRQFAQGIALSTYLARENGLYGSSNLDSLAIDQIHLLREDIIIEEINIFKEKDAVKKAEMIKNMNEAVYPKYLGSLSRLIAENKADNKSKFAVGTKFSLADIVIFESTTSLSQTNPDLLNKYPEVKAIREIVGQIDGIKQYLETRKKTDL
ncbi:glutathione S-transferase 7 [Biomphalaria pfeifferi]|uniref:Glutathione S-transferase 7 n=1 Tax=Biomphalaria pfeifferi TaxID=112525 RepID=A0AAD8C0I2_BIOPF|nr:glutathione S-transferase 7 [Biomphalaria pfeifferi]